MLFVWGKKIKRKRQGYAVDFCPYCRDFRRMTISRVGSAGHVYFISLGKGEHVRSEAVCLDCKGMQLVDASKYLEIVKKKREASEYGKLMIRSNPEIEQTMSERLAIEKQVREDPSKLAPEVRTKLLTEPIHESAATGEDIVNGGIYFDWHLSTAAIGTVLATTAAFHILDAFDKMEEDWGYNTMLGVGAVGGIICIILAIGSKGRRVRRILNPLLRKALRPLNPHVEELKGILQNYNTLAVGKHLRAEELESPGVR
jgi:hypothetical protein